MRRFSGSRIFYCDVFLLVDYQIAPDAAAAAAAASAAAASLAFKILT